MTTFIKFVIVLMTMTFTLNFVQGQNEQSCGTIPLTDSAMSLLPWYGNNEVLDSFTTAGLLRLAQNNPTTIRSGGNSCPEIDNQLFLPIKFFYVLDLNESPPPEIKQQQLIDWINEFYQSNGLPFRFYNSCPFSFINPDFVFINNYLESYIMYQGIHDDLAINVYVVDGIFSDIGGFHNAVGDYICVTKNIFNSKFSSTTLSHELGHFFGLQHTHRFIHAWFDCWREVVNRGAKFDFWCNLLGKFGTICSKNGDGLCDTPADPNDDGQYNCPYTSTETDIRGTKFEPDESNIMSYFNCRTSLSNSQKGVIWHNLLTLHSELLTLDQVFLNPDKYEPDQSAEIARIIKAGESQCHSMHNYCRDDIDYLKVDWVPFIGYYYFEIEDVPGSTNPVDEVTIFERNGNGFNGTEIYTNRSSNNGVRRYTISCSDISSPYGINIEIRRNARSEGKYIASLRKSNVLQINNDGKDCLAVGDVLSIDNLPPDCTVFWSSYPPVTFSNNLEGNPISVLDLNSNAAPITVKATVTQSNGCYEHVTKDFDLQVGGYSPVFEIDEIEKPCKVHGIIFTEGYYETNPHLEVDWSVSDGTLTPDQGFFTSFKPDQTGSVILYATYSDGCSMPRTVSRQIEVEDCDPYDPKLMADPNPCDDQVYVSVENVNTENTTNIIHILDLNSTIRLQLIAVGSSILIDVSTLEDGVYYINWSNGSINLSKMIIINH